MIYLHHRSINAPTILHEAMHGMPTPRDPWGTQHSDRVPMADAPTIANRSWSTIGGAQPGPNIKARLTSLPLSNVRSCNRKAFNIIIAI